MTSNVIAKCALMRDVYITYCCFDVSMKQKKLTNEITFSEECSFITLVDILVSCMNSGNIQAVTQDGGSPEGNGIH